MDRVGFLCVTSICSLSICQHKIEAKIQKRKIIYLQVTNSCVADHGRFSEIYIIEKNPFHIQLCKFK